MLRMASSCDEVEEAGKLLPQRTNEHTGSKRAMCVSWNRPGICALCGDFDHNAQHHIARNPS